MTDTSNRLSADTPPLLDPKALTQLIIAERKLPKSGHELAEAIDRYLQLAPIYVEAYDAAIALMRTDMDTYPYKLQPEGIMRFLWKETVSLVVLLYSVPYTSHIVPGISPEDIVGIEVPLQGYPFPICDENRLWQPDGHQLTWSELRLIAEEFRAHGDQQLLFPD